MKTYNYFFAAILVFAVTTLSLAQTRPSSTPAKTTTVKVFGNCESCKTRIEKAARIPGVATANWNMQTKQLTLTYAPEKVTLNKIQKSIAAVGHDTPPFKAPEKVYQALPGCCKYR